MLACNRSCLGAWAILLVGLSMLGLGCEDECISSVEEPNLPPAANEYRLMFSNDSGQIVELSVDGTSIGVFCPGVHRLYVGNFKRRECSVISAELFDLNRTKKLDDCDYLGYPTCIDNNTNGNICFDTTGSLLEVEAVIR